MTNKIIWSDCRSCKRSTKHSILGSVSKETPPEFYHEETKYFLLECNGCTSVSFRKEHHDYESYRQTGYRDEDYEYDISVEVFPHHIKNHSPIDSLFEIPSIVESIYKESLLAIQEGAYTLAGLGLRATIEAICNDKDVKGKNLQVRINAMNRSGMISKSDAERLHAIRFMGNDAAHEIKKAKEKSVLIALRIIEHILLSVYVFEEEVNKHLETPISSLEEALPILESNLLGIEANSIFTLTKWLGSSRRRVLEKLDEIESELITKIQNGEVNDVSTIETPDSEESTSQWYKKIVAETIEEPDSDE